MEYDDLLLRVTVVTVQPNAVLEVDFSGARAFWITEATKFGTSAGEVEIAFGDSGDFWAISPGDYCRPGGRINRVRLRLAPGIAAARTITFLHSIDSTFEAWNTARGL